MSLSLLFNRLASLDAKSPKPLNPICPHYNDSDQQLPGLARHGLCSALIRIWVLHGILSENIEYRPLLLIMFCGRSVL
jgi:hypothetical protein